MQENTIDQPPSLSQLLRESYLAEARAQQRHSEMSRSDASSSRLQIYGSLKGKAEDNVGHNDPQLTDLSAFLSQEELDKSVNLARQAIGHEPREERAEAKAPVASLTPSSISSASVPSSTSSSVSFSNPSPAPFAAPSNVPFPQPSPEFKELPATHTTFTSDRKMHKASTRQDNMIRNSRDSSEGFQDYNRSARNAPYGVETQSKKEFLNKAADFIEELSSLFKANSSKRVRPRACKTHRSRVQNKSQSDGTVYPLSSDNRERSVLPVEVEKERPSPAVSHQPVQLDPGTGHVEFQDCRITEEQQYDSVPQEAEEEAESFDLTDTTYPAEPVCEPPHFIQKLKSREVAEGCKVQLDCIVRGLPVPEVRWFCEGKELENSPDIQIITNGELHSLVIAEAFEEDTGRYSCFASNFYGTDSTSAEIYVEGASSSDSEGEQHFEHIAQLQRKQPKSSSSLPPSSSQTFPAEKEDSPEPAAAAEEPAEELCSTTTNQITVLEPLLPVRTSAAIFTATELSEVSVASIEPPAQEEVSVLPVQVFSTSAGDTALSEVQEESTPVPVISTQQPVQTATVIATSLPLSSAVLPVLSAPTQTPQPEGQTSNHNYPQGLNGQPIMAAPVFTKSLQDLLASEGQLVVLECRVKGVPSPRVDWYREGKHIEDSPDFRILQKKPRSPAESEEICTLVIAEVFPEDSGMFTCTANNKYGTVSSAAALWVKGNGSNSNHVRPFNSLMVEPSRIQEPFPSAPAEVVVSSSIKPHSSTIRLDPLVSSTLRLDPLNTSTLHLDPHSSSMLRPDPLRTSLPSLEPSSLTSTSSLNSRSTSTPNLDPLRLHQDPPASSGASSGAPPEPQSSRPIFSHPKPFVASSAVETSVQQEVSRPATMLPDTSSKVKRTPNHQNGSPVVVPLPDPPPNSCLKSGNLSNHKDSRSSSRVGLRVHFKLPEDEEEEQSDASCRSDEDINEMLGNKEPPPVLAKPKLDPAQLQLLHNQVLMEQQQESEPPTQTPIQPQSHPPFQIQLQPEVQSSHEGPLWSPRMYREPHVPPYQSYLSTTMTTVQQTPPSAPSLTTTPPAPSLTSAPAVRATFPPLINSSPAPPLSSPPSIPQLKTPSLMTSPPPAPQLNTAPSLSTAPVTQTIHASHLNLSPAALSRTPPNPPFCTPSAPKFSTVPVDSTPALQQITSPAPLLRSTHASLMNLSAISHTFNYARPKEFIAAQTFSPVRSPSPTESPVPLLHELAAELNSSAASSPTLPPFSPPPRIFPTRVLKSPTSPPSLVSSPTPGSASFLNSVFALRAQSPPQASSPTSSSSTPSPIQNPVAFLSSVLPSLTPSQATNSMGLPKGAPLGLQKKQPKTRLPPIEDIHESKELLLHDIEKKLRFRDDTPHFFHQQKLSNEGKTASRPLGPNIPATVINYDEEYKVSNFEQRLMSEIEFRLERTPVEESDDEVQHDDVPTGKCIAPIFDKKLKNFRAMEGVPVTFSCKLVGIPLPKVYWFKDGKQILRKNTHYRKIREGDGTCALHIESTTSDDDGNYTIMAANPQGRISCSGHLIVQSGPPRNRMTPIHSQRVRTRIQEVESEQTQERFFRPHFLQAPGDMMAHEGRLCRLDCKVSGLPSPELMWLVNGKPIYPDIYHKMLVRENGIHSLVIDPLMQGDAGTYTCIASNKAGQSSFSLDLKVVEKEMKHPPQFVEKLQNMGIPEGTPVRLECRVLGMPPPVIFWKKDNETIPRTKERISMTQDATGYVCLLIQPTTKEDAGWYTVSAKNEAGIISCTCRLDIYAQWHQSIPAPMKKAPRTGSRYAALTGQGLDIKSVFPTSDTSPILFSSSPPEATLESEEL
ncbi:myopalladin isoform X1 [Acanthochromis polyacanthus]|uniref:myopalladin isoform X1 n=1 Tax=Acanthochromis polyacanthus TaxID=80966 RepID=UPI002233EC00|nr:myopalladin isoform X1 [Acanthochromis polyacanthus]